MKDLTIHLQHGDLGRMGAALGAAGVSIEGGAAFAGAPAHFLVSDGDRAKTALEAVGIRVEAVRDVVVQRLHQHLPGQLGKLSQAMADAGVHIDALYSDHAHRLIVVTEQMKQASQVSAAWDRGAGKLHQYDVAMEWTGNTGSGTSSYRAYERSHVFRRGEKTLQGSSDPLFRGDASKWNPEELLVASLSACHQLQYLHLCATAGVVVQSYRDEAVGEMEEDGQGGGAFVRVVLKPRAQVAAASMRETAIALHEKAHSLCFIAASVRFPVELQATISLEGEA